MEKNKKFNYLSVCGLALAVIGAVLGICMAAGLDYNFLTYAFIICAVCALGLSIAGVITSKKFGSGKALGIAGIVVSALSLLAFVVFFILIVIILTSIGKG